MEVEEEVEKKSENFHYTHFQIESQPGSSDDIEDDDHHEDKLGACNLKIKYAATENVMDKNEIQKNSDHKDLNNIELKSSRNFENNPTEDGETSL